MFGVLRMCGDSFEAELLESHAINETIIQVHDTIVYYFCYRDIEITLTKIFIIIRLTKYCVVY